MSSHRSPKTKMPAYDAAKHRAFKDKARGIDCDSESEFSDSEIMISIKDEPTMSESQAARRRAWKDKARGIDCDSESIDSESSDSDQELSDDSDSDIAAIIALGVRRQHINKYGNDGIHVHSVQETGKVQARIVRLNVRGHMDVYKSGVIVEQTERDVIEYVTVKFRTKRQLLQGIQLQIEQLKNKIQVAEVDSPRKELFLVWASAEDGFSQEDIPRVARSRTSKDKARGIDSNNANKESTKPKYLNMPKESWLTRD
jgi:hypothetical protein